MLDIFTFCLKKVDFLGGGGSTPPPWFLAYMSAKVSFFWRTPSVEAPNFSIQFTGDMLFKLKKHCHYQIIFIYK